RKYLVISLSAYFSGKETFSLISFLLFSFLLKSFLLLLVWFTAVGISDVGISTVGILNDSSISMYSISQCPSLFWNLSRINMPTDSNFFKDVLIELKPSLV